MSYLQPFTSSNLPLSENQRYALLSLSTQHRRRRDNAVRPSRELFRLHQTVQNSKTSQQLASLSQFQGSRTEGTCSEFSCYSRCYLEDIAELGCNESPNVRQFYEKQAEQCRVDHNIKYPLYKLQLELSGKTSRARPRASSKRPSKTNCSGVIPQQSPSLPHPQPRSACSSTTATPDKAYVEDFNWSSIYRTASAPCWSSQAPVYQPDYSAPATFRENLEWCSPPSWDTSLLPWPSFSSETYYHSWE